MHYQLYFILIQYILLTECTDIDKNTSDIYIKYSGHSDLDRPEPETVLGNSEPNTEKIKPVTEKGQLYADATEGIVFIPNDKPVFRNEDAVYDGGIKIDAAIESRRIGGLMKNNEIHITETESPKADILFVSGKNNENVEKPVEVAKKRERPDSTVVRTPKVNKKRLNCTHLDCNNTISSVCGGKEENKQTKYRLFLNECFFRKVNCAFQHAVNRYDVVPMEYCKNVGAHHLTRPYVFKPMAQAAQKVEGGGGVDTRRSFSSRRSLNRAVDGSYCAHACPASCTEDYDPQCAVSSSGQRKVFLNHCKLDYNSCLYKVVWHRRPLSECVGGKKADMTQNRGFIGWMQRVGIVDGRGKLVLS